MSDTSSAAWFRAAHFGLFVHWGLYAIPAGSWRGKEVDYIGEWIQHGERIPRAEYERLAAAFDPTAFDARAWVDLARRAGMRYLVFTAKHHEGFAMWRSRVDPFNIVDATPSRRDVLAELAAACAEGGIRLGIYYSHCVDWHEPHAGNGAEDLKLDDAQPGRRWGNDWDHPIATAAGFAEYLERKVKPQLTELLTGYGDIALLWFDTPMPSLSRAQAQEIHDLVKRLQPGCLVHGRIGRDLGEIAGLGDNQLPEGISDRLVEACITLNETWGYKAHDRAWKDPAAVVDLLARCASRDCNLLLNIGPMADGRLPPAAVERLEAVAAWMAVNGAALDGAVAVDAPLDPPQGRLMRNGDRLFYLATDGSARRAELPGLRTPVLAARLLGDGRTLAIRSDDDGPAFDLPPAVDGMPRVVELRLAGAPLFDRQLRERAGEAWLPARLATRAGAPWDGGGHTGQEVEWTLRIATAGRFAVGLVNGGDLYHEWKGGHEVALDAGGRALSARLAADELEPGPMVHHYPVYSSRLGELELPAGTHRLRLRFGEGATRIIGLRLRRLS